MSKDVVTLGEAVARVRGKVTPRAAGAKVVLRQRLDGQKTWAVSTRTKIRRNGTTSYTPPSWCRSPAARRTSSAPSAVCARPARTTYALDDRSESGAAGAVKLIVDGVTKVDQGLVVGQVVESTTDLTDALRLRYELTSTASPVS